MARKEIRDARNFVVGYEVRDGNRTYIQNLGGINQGMYDHNLNQTQDTGGIMKSRGNTLLAFLFNHKR